MMMMMMKMIHPSKIPYSIIGAQPWGEAKNQQDLQYHTVSAASLGQVNWNPPRLLCVLSNGTGKTGGWPARGRQKGVCWREGYKRHHKGKSVQNSFFVDDVLLHKGEIFQALRYRCVAFVSWGLWGLCQQSCAIPGNLSQNFWKKSSWADLLGGVFFLVFTPIPEVSWSSLISTYVSFIL